VLPVEIFENFFEADGGFQFISRAGHILVGITWIGLLYFFNFVQTPSFAEMEAGARSEALRKLTLRGLWWFRWAAAATLAFGIVMLGIYTSAEDSNYLEGATGASILTGILFGLTMFLNVWLVIWPNQKINIASADAVAAGGQADPRQPEAAKKGARASRANVLMSIPMLWFMVFTQHFSFKFANPLTGDVDNMAIYWILVLALWALVEGSALGLIGGLDSPFNKAAFDDHKQTLIYGFILWAVIFVVGWELILKAS
jgi:uncharacterized membrane protein